SVTSILTNNKMSLKLIGVLVLVLLQLGLIEAHCRRYYTEFEGKCYRYYGNPVKNWEDAEASCVRRRGHLASIHNTEEEEFLQELWRSTRDFYTNVDVLSYFVAPISRAPFVYIGLNDRDLQNVYKWTDGTPFDFSDWMPIDPRPIDREREDGVFMWDRRGNKGRWNDVNSRSVNMLGPYICQL
ncbi:lectin-like protein, partial [Salmonella sp. s54496]